MERKENRDTTLSLDDIIKEVREERKSIGQESKDEKPSSSGTGIWKTEAFAQWKDELTEVEQDEDPVEGTPASDAEKPKRSGRKRKKKEQKEKKAEKAAKTAKITKRVEAEEDRPETPRNIPYDCIRYDREDPADTVRYLQKKIRRSVSRLLLMLPFVATALYLMFYDAGAVPLPTLPDARIPAIVACVCLLLCMVLSWEVQWSGFRRLLMLRPSLDSLVFFQCAAAMTHGVWSICLPEFSGGNGFCALACLSCFFTLRQKRNRMITVRRGFKTAMVGAMPAGIKVCSDYVGNRVAVKSHDGAEPDFRTIARPDRGEEASLWFSPLLIVLTVIYAVVIGFEQQKWMLLPWYFAALSAVAVSGGLILASAPAARKIGKQLFASGCMLVNGQCAKIISKTGFAILCDRDIYPMGTMKITGMKVVSPFDKDVATVVRYVAGVMVFLGGGIGKAFSDFAREQDTFPAKVQHQKFYESGGIVAEIDGHTVLVGTVMFLNRFGIAVTEGRKVKRGVFVAIDNRFAGLFSVNAEAQSQVYHAFTLLQQAKVRPVLDVLNFLTDQDMIEKAFELKHDSTDYPDLNERIYGSEGDFAADEPPMALLAREGMLSFAEALLGARRLSRVTGFNLTIGIGSALLGVAAMYLLLSTGAAAATPVNTFAYTMLCSLPVWARTAFGARI